MIEINDKKYYSPEEAGKILGIAAYCVRSLIRSGKLECFRPSAKKIYIEAKQIEKYIEQ